MARRRATWWLLGGLSSLVAIVGVGMSVMSSLDPETKILAATAGGIRVPRTFARYYVTTLWAPDPLYRTATGQTLVQFALAGYNLSTEDTTSNSAILSVADSLIDKGVPVDATSTTGFSALHDAVLSNDSPVVELLIRKKVDVNAPVSLGQHAGATPLRLADTLAVSPKAPDRSAIVRMLENAGGHR